MAISLSHVRFNYPDHPDRPVLNIPSWIISPGEQVFVHGPSGGGKSTLLNLISGMLPASNGHISILGQRLDQMTSRQRDQFRAGHIGYVFQQFNLIPYLDAIDNICLANHFSRGEKKPSLHDEIKTILSTLNILSDDWHTPTGRLSIGQQQRIAIARALINRPQVLIADEPTSSLDQKNRDSFMTLLMSTATNHNMTLLFVSHDLSLSRYFSRVEPLSDINQIEFMS